MARTLVPATLTFQDPGPDCRPGSLLSWVPIFHLHDRIFLFESPPGVGGPGRLIPEDRVRRWNQGDTEAAVLVSGKARRAIVLDEIAERASWWVLPLFGRYAGHSSPHPAIIAVAPDPSRGISASYVDVRRACEIPDRLVRKREHLIGQLSMASDSYLRKRFAAFVLKGVM